MPRATSGAALVASPAQANSQRGARIELPAIRTGQGAIAYAGGGARRLGEQRPGGQQDQQQRKCDKGRVHQANHHALGDEPAKLPNGKSSQRRVARDAFGHKPDFADAKGQADMD